MTGGRSVISYQPVILRRREFNEDGLLGDDRTHPRAVVQADELANRWKDEQRHEPRQDGEEVEDADE